MGRTKRQLRVAEKIGRETCTGDRGERCVTDGREDLAHLLVKVIARANAALS